jgi:uncharacterized protein (DUF1499 family)
MKRAAVLLVWAGAAIALASVAAAAGAGLGNRIGVWDYRVALTALRWSVYVAAGAGVVALAGSAVAAAGRFPLQVIVGLAGTAIAIALVLPAWNLQRAASQLPRIHDITTDTVNPPQFVALLAARQAAPNGAAYGGPKIAQEQKKGYPDIGPALTNVPPAKAFERALAVARDLGWEVAASNPDEGRIEATDITLWFGFKDDVVIRITATPAGSRVDIRSMSRVGWSDLGTNARRIRAFLAALRAQS